MIDLHCHILPEVDDGPQSLEETLRMARFFVEDGVVNVSTGGFHHPCSQPAVLKNLFQVLRQQTPGYVQVPGTKAVGQRCRARRCLAILGELQLRP